MKPELFDPENENQREAYFYSLILLFTLFKYESDLLLENKTAEEAFHRVVNTECSAYHAKLTVMLEARTNIKKINEARQADDQEEKISKDDAPQLMGEAKNSMNDVLDMNDNSRDMLSLEDRVGMLNADQWMHYTNTSGFACFSYSGRGATGTCHMEPRPRPPGFRSHTQT